MKKILLSLIVLAGIGFSAKVKAQCTVSNLAIEVLTFNTATCQVTFNISFEQEVNSGNKFAYIHLWRDAQYHTPAGDWPGGGSAVYSGPSKYPEAAQLVNALATIAVEFNGTASPVIGSVYYPDVTVTPLSAGLSITKTILPGGIRERETISGLSLTLPVCSGVVTFKGDIWASQAANGKNVHCAVEGLSFAINNPVLTGFKVCSPRSITFGIQNNGLTPLTEHFNLYKDDGDGIFEPFIGLGGDGLAIYTSTDTTLSAGASQSRVQFAYPGSALPGEGASIWLEAVVPATGFTTVRFLSHNDAGCVLLPVQFKSFTAVRSRSNVILKWETMWEQNSAGFAIERNTNGAWEQVGYVASLAMNGNSSDALSYQHIDVNNTKGITQYRIKQVDFDNKAKYSEIRSVRGENQMGQIIVYPNPSTDGKVNVSFEEAATRDITVADMSGRVIRQMKGVSSNNITIDNLTPGMYNLRVIIPSTGEQAVAKIVVNKR